MPERHRVKLVFDGGGVGAELMKAALAQESPGETA
jgi:hypothetical protein